MSKTEDGKVFGTQTDGPFAAQSLQDLWEVSKTAFTEDELALCTKVLAQTLSIAARSVPLLDALAVSVERVNAGETVLIGDVAVQRDQQAVVARDPEGKLIAAWSTGNAARVVLVDVLHHVVMKGEGL